MESRESKMLNKVRRWWKKAYETHKGKPSPKRRKEAEELARKFDLPFPRWDFQE